MGRFIDGEECGTCGGRGSFIVTDDKCGNLKIGMNGHRKGEPLVFEVKCDVCKGRGCEVIEISTASSNGYGGKSRDAGGGRKRRV